MQTFLAPWVCLIWGFWSLILTLYRRKYGWKIKLSTLLFAVVGIPVGIAYLCQYFGFKEQKLSEIYKQLQNWEISEHKAKALIKLFED